MKNLRIGLLGRRDKVSLKLELKLHKNDAKVFEFLSNWRVANYLQLSLLLNRLETQTMYRRMQKLEQHNYVYATRIFYKQRTVYTLTRKGLNYVSKMGQSPYIIKEGTLRHELGIVDVVLYHHLYQKISLDNLLNEVKMRQLSERDNNWDLKHYPDIATADKKIAIEFERTAKTIERLEENILNNFKHFDIQIWYVHERHKTLQENLKLLKEKHLINLHILYIEDLQKRLYENVTYMNKTIGGSYV